MTIFLIFWIFLINFCAHSHYFRFQFWRIAKKIREYGSFKSSQYLFNFLYLAELLRGTKRSVPYIKTVKAEVCELGHHFYNMRVAFEKNLIYCPSKGGAKHDGCFFDPSREEITELLQFKTKMPGSNLSLVQLNGFLEEYRDMHQLQIGFVKSEDYERFKVLIAKVSEIQLVLGHKLQISAHNFSCFATGQLDASFVRELMSRQISFSKQIEMVNDNMVDNIGNIF